MEPTYMATITPEGVIMPYTLFTQRMGKVADAYLKKLTLRYVPNTGPPIVAKSYRIERWNGVLTIILPRTSIDFLLSTGIVSAANVKFPSPTRDSAPQILCEGPPPLTFYAQLFPGQQLVVDEILARYLTPENIAAGRGCCLLNLRAGMGKTWVAAAVVARLGMRALYIAPRRPLCIQAARDIRGCLNDEDTGADAVAVSMYKGNGAWEKHAADTVTVIVINSAITAPAEFIAGYDMLIMDEIHTYCSKERMKVFRRLRPAVLGMSATTEHRTDKMDPLVHREVAFAPGGVGSGTPGAILRAEEIPGFTYDDVHFDATVVLARYNGPPELTQTLRHESTDKMFMPYMHDQFLRDPARSELAVQYLRELYEWRGPRGEQHTIYVFCEYRDPLRELQAQFTAAIGADVDAPELGEFIGGIADAEVQRIKDGARVILTTYGYSGTGVSIDRATAILFLTSRRANMQQILARILRRGGDQSIRRRIIDIIDNRTPVRNQLTDRKLAYEFYGMEIEEAKWASVGGKLVRLPDKKQ